jgi:hypothetical protein
MKPSPTSRDRSGIGSIDLGSSISVAIPANATPIATKNKKPNTRPSWPDQNRI